jgi:hypothetical protein
VGGVVCNSDGADLAVYWYSMPGIWVWGMVIALHGAILISYKKQLISNKE